MELKNIDLIIFDCDGTLVDTETITAQLMTDMLNELGINITLEDCTARFIGTKFSDVHAFVTSHGIPIEAEGFELNYRNRCKVAFENDLSPIPGVTTLLDKLKVPFCIASNGPKEKMNITLDTTGLKPYFKDQHIFSAYDIKKWKPEPDLFLNASDSMGYQGQRCLVVEDTIHGVKAALTANMKVTAVNVKHQLEDILNLGVPVYDNIRDLSKDLYDHGYLI